MFPGSQIGPSPRCQIEISLGQSNRIFRGSPGDVGGARPRDVLGTNICRLGKNLETRVISEVPSNIDTLVNCQKKLPETFGSPVKSILKKVGVVSNAHHINLVFDKTI